MNNRILVHMIFQTNCISFKTISRFCKSPHCFYVLRSRLAELEHNSNIIVHDINSFAILYRDINAGIVEIDFTWLSGDGYNVSGYRETIILPYDMFKSYLMKKTSDDSSITWKVLSVDNTTKRPQIVFKNKKNLHSVLTNRVLRHKLVRFLRDGFNWLSAEKIELYDDFIPYSFTFREIKNGKPAISGGLVLHDQENMQKAYYSIHT